MKNDLFKRGISNCMEPSTLINELKGVGVYINNLVKDLELFFGVDGASNPNLKPTYITSAIQVNVW